MVNSVQGILSGSLLSQNYFQKSPHIFHHASLGGPGSQVLASVSEYPLFSSSGITISLGVKRASMFSLEYPYIHLELYVPSLFHLE